MPDHQDWPPALRYTERILRAIGYTLIAGLTFFGPSFWGITLIGGTIGVLSVALRSWHLELISVGPLTFVLLGYAVLSSSAELRILAAFAAFMIARRGVELLMFSEQNRRIKRIQFQIYELNKRADPPDVMQ